MLPDSRLEKADYLNGIDAFRPKEAHKYRAFSQYRASVGASLLAIAFVQAAQWSAVGSHREQSSVDRLLLQG